MLGGPGITDLDAFLIFFLTFHGISCCRGLGIIRGFGGREIMRRDVVEQAAYGAVCWWRVMFSATPNLTSVKKAAIAHPRLSASVSRAVPL